MLKPSALISPAYLGEQRALHALPQGYGGKGRKWADTVSWLVSHYGASSVLDYGCGQGSLIAELMQRRDTSGALRHVRLAEYDPAIEGKSAQPGFADLVVCTDVLEHIEPDRLEAVLRHLRILARRVVLFVVALDPANKWLSDGRNAHLILESPAWWALTVETAGFQFEDVLGRMPLPVAYSDAQKRAKRWIAVARPC